MKFGPSISRSQAFNSSRQRKKNWCHGMIDHMMYMMAVGDAFGGAPDQVLENIAKYAW